MLMNGNNIFKCLKYKTTSLVGETKRLVIRVLFAFFVVIVIQAPSKV